MNRTNNFDLIRLIASLEVAIGHTLSHLEIPDFQLFNSIWGGVKMPFPGVFVFFVISGFLITASLERNKNNIKKYLTNRLLRIVPALWIAFILILIVLINFDFVNEETLKEPTLWAWFIGQLTLFQFYTPDCLRGFGVSCPNGSLWTIPVEFIFYLVLPLLFKIKIKRNFLLVICFVLSIGINFTMNQFSEELLIYKLLDVSIFPWLYIFLFGSLIYINWSKVKHLIEGKAFIYILVYLFYVNMVSTPSYNLTSLGVLGANLLLGLMTISIAFTIPSLGSILKGFDISYGLYVYHMIVVNCFVQMKLLYEPKYAIYAMGISILMGCLSWYFIERKVLSLKNKICLP